MFDYIFSKTVTFSVVFFINLAALYAVHSLLIRVKSEGIEPILKGALYITAGTWILRTIISPLSPLISAVVVGFVCAIVLSAGIWRQSNSPIGLIGRSLGSAYLGATLIALVNATITLIAPAAHF